MTISSLFYRLYSHQRQYYSILCHVLCVVSLCFYAEMNLFASLKKKVTNCPKSSAVNDGIIFTLLL